MNHLDSSVIILILAAADGLSILFLHCYFGKLATDSFLNMTDCLFECNWQDLPIELQKYFIMLIENAQRPLYYHGFKIAVIDLVTFAKVKLTIYHQNN